MGKLSDVIRRSGAHEPYADAIAVKAAIEGLEKKMVPFSFDETATLAGTSAELIAPCDGAITAIYLTVTKDVTTGGPVTVSVGTTAVAGLSVTVADAAVKGTRYSDTSLTNDGTELVKKGDRIQVTPDAAFATAGSLSGYLEITQSS